MFDRLVCRTRRALLLLGCLAVAGGASAQSIGNTLMTNQSLLTKQELVSTNKKYKAILWEDGNLTIHQADVNPWKEVWASRSKGGTKLIMQGDGNLCTANNSGGNTWCNYGNYGAGDYFLVMRDYGALEVYKGKPNATAQAQLVWTSVLDAGYYSNKYGDLKQAFGGDARKLMEHWITYGQFEGRSPNPAVRDVWQEARNVKLDTMFYANKYPDLKQAFGFDAARLLQHWKDYGMKEGRVPNKPTDDFVTPPPRSANGRDIMRVGDWLREGETMWSRNRQYRLDLQADAQLVIYQGSVSDAGRRWFQNNRGYPIDKYFAILQGDGHICVYRGTGPNDNKGGIGCSPAGAGGPQGRYFAALQDDGNLAIYKGNGPDDQRGWVWDRITTKPSSGFNFNAVAESVGNFVVNSANTVARETVNAVNATVGVANHTANVVATGTTYAANELARETVNAANVVANTTVSTANTVKDGTVRLGNQIVDGSRMVGSTVGNEVVKNGKIVGREIVKNGQKVGEAVVDVANQAWAYLQNNCGDIGRTVMPIGGGQIGQAVGLMERYGSSVPEIKAGTQCYRWAEDGFYCSFPQELADLVSGTGDMARNLPELAKRVWGEMGSQECIYTVAATPVLPAAPAMCGLGKVMVEDAIKAFACVSAAQSSDEVKRALPSFSFPSEGGCKGIGIIAFKVAEKVVTRNLSAEAKAAQAAGKSFTAAVVAQELKNFYAASSAASKYQELTEALNRMPACGGTAPPQGSPAPAGTAAPSGPVAVAAAWYGSEAQPGWTVGGVSVAQRIANGMQSGVIVVPANMNAFFGGDPLPGQAKVVAVAVRLATGQIVNLRQQEGRELRFPGRENIDYIIAR